MSSVCQISEVYWPGRKSVCIYALLNRNNTCSQSIAIRLVKYKLAPNQQRKRNNNRRRRPRRKKNGSGPNMRGNRTSAVAIPKYGTFPFLNRLNVFNLRYKAHLRYHTDVDMGVQGSSPLGYVFSANGLYDPDITSTGHQPMGFDQLMTFFQHYTVLNAQISIQVRNYLVVTGQCVEMAVAIQRSTTVLSVWDRLIEAGNVTYGCISAIPNGGGPIPPWFRSRVRIADFQSVPNVLNDDTLRGTAAANPATQVYFVIYSRLPDAAGPSSEHLFFSVTMEFDAVFTEPLQPIES